MQSERSAVVIELLQWWHRPLLWWYRRRGYRIFFLRATPGLSSWAASKTWLAPLDLAEPVHWGHHPGGDLAFEAVDREYPFWAEHPLILRLVRLYRDPDLHLAFRKSLCFERERQAYYQVLRTRIAAALPRGPWFLLPVAPHDEAAAWSDRQTWPGLDRPWWLSAAATIRLALERLLWLGYAAFTLIQALRPLPRYRPSRRRQWTYGVAVVSPAREFANDLRGVGFLLDGQRIRRDNTVFIPLVPLPPQGQRIMREKGLALVDLPAAVGDARWHIVGGVLSMLVHLAAPPWVLRGVAHLLREYGRWQAFRAEHHVEHFISYADFSLRQIGRNILLRHDGTTTWYYADSVNTADTLYTRPHRNPAWGWLYYDVFVSWSDWLTRYLRMHPQRIGRFVEVGCLWSEHVRLLREGAIPSSLPFRLASEEGRKVVAVFDSTYRDDMATTYHDGIEFARGILRLLEERPDVVVVWKEKKPRSYHLKRDGGALMRLYERLAAHPRCLFIGHEVSPAEPLAVCDLAISFPFSSTSLEALAAGVKAVYFDPTGKYRGSSYSKLEGLVTHSYMELRHRVDELLDRTPTETFRAYTERVVKKALDPYADGYGLTRFRELLAGAAPATGPQLIQR